MLNKKLDIAALAGLLFLLLASASAGAQTRARADLKDSTGKTVGTVARRPIGRSNRQREKRHATVQGQLESGSNPGAGCPRAATESKEVSSQAD